MKKKLFYGVADGLEHLIWFKINVHSKADHLPLDGDVYSIVL